MPRKKAEETVEVDTNVTPNDLGWTDYVLGLLSDDEKIKGNPTTDGLRRVFEIALECTVINSESIVQQTPDLNNANRATVAHSLTYVLNDSKVDPAIKTRTVNGAADDIGVIAIRFLEIIQLQLLRLGQKAGHCAELETS